MKNKKTLVAVLGILGIIFATVGVTYAFFSYSRTGTKENKIKSGAITFHYKEESRGISIGDVMPMTDIQGKAQSNYFDFTVKSKTSDTVDIPYYITAIRSGTGTNMDGIVKVYLTKVDSQGNETEVALSKFSELGTYTNSDRINIPENEKLLYRTSVYAGDRNYNQKYRLRMWIDTNANFISKVTKYYCDNDEVELNSEEYTNCENEITTRSENVYPYEGKTYTIKVNVYGSGEEVTQSQQELRENVNIEDIEIGSNTVTSSTNTLTESETMPVGSTTIQKTITVNTVNPNSVVTIENLTPTSSLISNIKRLSSNHNVDLVLGTNTFKITVSSITRKSHKEYTLVIEVDYPKYDVTLSGSNISFGSNSISVGYGSSNTVTVTPSSGYYLASVSCTNGYTTNATTGISATSVQTVTITNNNYEGTGSCTFGVTPITYLITYNLNDGIQGSNPKYSYTIVDETFNLPTPTKVNYNFDGWYTNSNFTGEAITQIPKGSLGNKEYWAKWENTNNPKSFATDSWDVIVEAVKTGDLAQYNQDMANGITRNITLGGNLGTHQLRIANTKSCAAAKRQKSTITSETGCGFVIEFADIIKLYKYNSSRSNVGGYPASQLYSYLTSTVLNALTNALPSVVVNSMLPTVVVSGHGDSDSTCTVSSTRDSNCNFVLTNQKIYLFDRQEVFGDNSQYNTGAVRTRQLDYYALGKSKEKKYNNDSVYWWLRSAASHDNLSFNIIYQNGSANSYWAEYEYGISPAFRIGPLPEDANN